MSMQLRWAAVALALAVSGCASLSNAERDRASERAALVDLKAQRTPHVVEPCQHRTLA